MDHTYKVVLLFNLTLGAADEELRRSREPDSFPNRLAKQPGFVQMELVKVDEDRTMSIQTWDSANSWWTALEATKSEPTAVSPAREEILLSREFYAGEVAHIVPA